MHNPILSICIPTYNRPEKLPEALASIMSQFEDGVEVIVIDDGSDTDIRKIVAPWESQYPGRIRFDRNEKNLGFDRNLVRCIEQASGTYCWFMSDDDILKPGSLSRVLALLKESDTNKFILTNYTKFDNKTGEIVEENMIRLSDDEKFKSLEDFFFKPTPGSYFNYLGKNLIYMSVLIFSREHWLKYVKNCKSYIGKTSSIHIFILLHVLAIEKPAIFFISSPLVLYRTGNQRPWPNHIWVTYHTKFLQLAKKLGLSWKKITTLQIVYLRTYRRFLLTYFIRKALGLKTV